MHKRKLTGKARDQKLLMGMSPQLQSEVSITLTLGQRFRRVFFWKKYGWDVSDFGKVSKCLFMRAAHFLHKHVVKDVYIYIYFLTYHISLICALKLFLF